MNFLGRAWTQVRWQLAMSFLLTGMLSVALVIAFALAIGNMWLRRGSVSVVQHQVETLTYWASTMAASAAENLAHNWGDPVDRVEGERLVRILAGAFPGAKVAVNCQDATGKALTFTAPPGAALERPAWLHQDDFRGVVSNEGRLDIFAVARRSETCSGEVMLSLPLEERTVAMLSSASDMEIRLTRAENTESWSPGLLEIPGLGPLLRRLGVGGRPGIGGWVPVVIVATNWSTGLREDWVVFQVRPSFSATVRRLAQFGQQRAQWVWVLSLLAASLAAVGVAAVYVAHRITRRILLSVSDLTRGAGEISRGNLAHRIPLRHEGELGDLSESFNQMTASIERLLAETKEKERLEQELQVAREVQQSLYPRELPTLPHMQIAAARQPARVVSGDLYDFIEIGSNGLGLLCADVSGKGIPAALLMANLQAIVRGCIGAACRGLADGPCAMPDPSDLVGQVNKELCRRIPDEAFATLFWADYDTESQVLRYVNAGHNPPFLSSPSSADGRRLDKGGLPAGLFPATSYESEEVLLVPGSALLLYTDGLTDAVNEEGTSFGEERLQELWQSCWQQPPAVIVAGIMDNVRQWSGETEQFDDITLIVFKIEE